MKSMPLDDDGNLLERGYLTLPQLVKYIQAHYPVLACSYPTMAKRLDEGEIPYVEVGKQRRVTKEAIEAWVEKCMHPEQKKPVKSFGEALGPLLSPTDVIPPGADDDEF